MPRQCMPPHDATNRTGRRSRGWSPAARTGVRRLGPPASRREWCGRRSVDHEIREIQRVEQAQAEEEMRVLDAGRRPLALGACAQKRRCVRREPYPAVMAAGMAHRERGSSPGRRGDGTPLLAVRWRAGHRRSVIGRRASRLLQRTRRDAGRGQRDASCATPVGSCTPKSPRPPEGIPLDRRRPTLRVQSASRTTSPLL